MSATASIASSRSLIRPEGGVELIGRYRFVAAPAATPGLLLELADGREQKARCRSCRWMTWPVVRESRTAPTAAILTAPGLLAYG
jgi:hypothetical protein